MTVQLQQAGDDGLRLSGELNMASVAGMVDALRAPLAKTSGVLRIDLAEVTRSDSAGLALMLEWLREARERKVELRFINLPPQLRAIAEVSDLLPLLPLE